MKTTLLIAVLAVFTCARAEEAAPPLRDLLKPAQVAALESSEAQLRKLAQAQLNSRDSRGAGEIIRLLDLPRQPAPEAAALIGKWKVRSIQAADYGVFDYPFFDCEIHLEGELGLIFHKHTGSQRRLGNLAPDGASRYLFFGGAYVQGEAPRGFSGFQDESVKADPAHDSIGYLYRITPDHYLLLFTGTGTRGELYELKKP